MKFRLTKWIRLQKITICLFILTCFICELQAEEVEQGTYTDLTKALQNPSKVRVLNLSGQELATLPKEIGQLQNLQELYLNGNQLKTLPSEIEFLKKLKILRLYQNEFSSAEKERIRKALPNCEVDFGDK
ncbi:leucine rich repeat protein [Leptospira weilii serovar Topaz str. LT2116]|uniref:Leucine rich repeat protein n=1 Tax=Leptospira weilii serovar Topaz str. LT2116 TaxID=1088540 RepID=M3FUB4_9LEPT|nr:leucine rich repeat protein [Leptospira weilii serovar Topaz str. LT2116]